MTDTLANTPIEAEEYQDVYALTSIRPGTSINIQNVGVTDLFFAIALIQPAKDNEAFRIFKRGDVIPADDSDMSVWVFSPQADGAINVEKLKNSKISDLLLEHLQKFSCQNQEIIDQLKLLNLKTEEMGNTGTSIRDIES